MTTKQTTDYDPQKVMKRDLKARIENQIKDRGRFSKFMWWFTGGYSNMYLLGYECGHIDGQLSMIEYVNKSLGIKSDSK